MRRIRFIPFVGAFAGYYGSQLAGITNGVTRFLAGVGCMILAVLGGFLVSKRSRG